MLPCRWTPILVLLGAASACGAPLDADAARPWREQLRSGDALARQDAAEELGRLGARARASIPDLIHCLREPYLKRPCMRALARIGTPAVPALLRALEVEETHNAAFQTLDRLGPLPLPFLLRIVKRGTPAARLWALHALEKLGPKAEPAIPTLVAVLHQRRLRLAVEFKELIPNVTCAPSIKAPILSMNDERLAERSAAAQALAAIGPAAVPALLDVLEARKNRLRPSALFDLMLSARADLWPALTAQAAEEPVLLPCSLVVLAQMASFGPAVKDPDWTARCLATEAIRKMNPSPRSATPALLRALRSCGEPGKSNGPRLAVAANLRDSLGSPELAIFRALKQVGVEDRAAIPTLLRALRHPRLAGIADDAVSLLLSLGEEGREQLRREGLPILLERIKEDDLQALHAVGLALNDLGPRETAAALAAAEEMLQRQDRRGAISPDIFDFLGNAGAKAAPVLMRMLAHHNSIIRTQAAFVLGRIEPLPQAALPALKRLLKDPEPGVRVTALEALDRLDPTPRPHLARLIAALKDREQAIQRWALSKLAELGPEARPALPQVRRLLASGNSDLKLAATGVLLSVEKSSPALLTQLLNNPDAQVRKAVITIVANQRGPSSPKIVAALRRLQHSEDSEVSHLASVALIRVCPEDVRVVLSRLATTLRKDANDDKALERLRELLAVLPEAFPCTTPPGDGLLYDGDAEKKRALAPVVRALLPLLENESLWPWAAVCLAHLGPQPRAVPALLVRLQDDRAEERAFAVACLGCLADRSPQIVERLRRFQEDEEPVVRVAAATALLQLTGQQKTYGPILERELPKGFEAVGLFAELLPALRRLLVPPLLAILKRAEPAERTPFITALGHLGAEAGPAVPTLMEYLADPPSADCRAAVDTLGKIGPRARAALPRLRQLARDRDMAAQAQAAVQAIACNDD